MELAQGGREALEALDASDFTVVLMDLEMPGVDGWAATTELRRREKSTGWRVPVIAITAHAMAAERHRCLAAGMDDVLIKPFTAAALNSALDRRAGRTRGLETPSPS